MRSHVASSDSAALVVECFRSNVNRFYGIPGTVLIPKTSLRLALMCPVFICWANAQQFDFPPPSASDSAALSNSMAALAKATIPIYKDERGDKYLDNLVRLQMVRGDFAEARKSLVQLRDMRVHTDAARAAWANVQYEIYAQAKATAAASGLPFEKAYQETFRGVFRDLGDRASALAVRLLSAPDLAVNQRSLES